MNPHKCNTTGADCGRCPLGPTGFIFQSIAINDNGELSAPVDISRTAEWSPVPPEIKQDSDRPRGIPRIAFITSAPSVADAEMGRPLTDRDATELHIALAAADTTRATIDIFPDVACATKMRSEELENAIKSAQNIATEAFIRDGHAKKNAKILAVQKYPHPIDCCRPKLLREIAEYDNFIIGGASSYRALTGVRKAIDSIAGDPVVVSESEKDATLLNKPLKYIATWHHRFILRSPGYREEYGNHIAKALRLFSPAGLNWPPYKKRLIQSPSELREWLTEKRKLVPYFAADIETFLAGNETIFDCRTSVIDMLQLATPDMNAECEATTALSDIVHEAETIAIRFYWFSTKQLACSITEYIEYWEILKEFLEDPKTVIVGHNFIAYDAEVLLNRHQIRVTSIIDTIFPTRAVWPDMRKSLKLVGRRLTDVDRWETNAKGEKVVSSENDDTRLEYALTDALVNVRIVEPLLKRATARGYFTPLPAEYCPPYYQSVCAEYNCSPRNFSGGFDFNLFNLDQTRQGFCSRQMHDRGIFVDQAQVNSLVNMYSKYLESVKSRLAANLRLAGVASEHTAGMIAEELDNDTALTAEEKEILEVEAATSQFNTLQSEISQLTEIDIESARAKVSSSTKFRDLLYREWQLPVPPNTPPDFSLSLEDMKTDTGLYGTGNAVLIAYLGCKNLLTPLQRAIIQDKRIIARIGTKILGTTLYPLMRYPPKKKKTLIHHDGRVRSSIRAFVTAPGRYASAAPNMQNFGNKKGQELLPTVFSCPQGRMLIGYDVDQFHIRIMANFWGITRYVLGFEAGIDPHVGMARIMTSLDDVRGWSENDRAQLIASGLSEAQVLEELRTRENRNGWGADGYNPKKKPKFGKAKGLRDTAKGVGYTWAYLCLLARTQIAHAASKMTGTLKANEVVKLVKSGAAAIDHVCGLPPGHELRKSKECGCSIPELILPFIDLSPVTTESWLTKIFDDPDEQCWKVAWQTALAYYRENKLNNLGVGFMESYYFKRRSGNLSDGKAQEVVNFPILSSEQDIMSLMEFAGINLCQTDWAHLDPAYILQVHDACKFEINDPAGPNAPRCEPGHDKKWTEKCPHCVARNTVASQLAKAVTIHIPGDKVGYTVEEHWGWTLADI